MTVFGTHPGAFSREAISASVRNGFFTGALTARLRSQGKSTDVRQLLGGVRDDVMEATGGRQQPYIAGSLHEDLCLVVPSDALEPVRPARAAVQRPCIQSIQCSVFCFRYPSVSGHQLRRATWRPYYVTCPMASPRVRVL